MCEEFIDHYVAKRLEAHTVANTRRASDYIALRPCFRVAFSIGRACEHDRMARSICTQRPWRNGVIIDFKHDCGGAIAQSHGAFFVGKMKIEWPDDIPYPIHRLDIRWIVSNHQIRTSLLNCHLR